MEWAENESNLAADQPPGDAAPMGDGQAASPLHQSAEIWRWRHPGNPGNLKSPDFSELPDVETLRQAGISETDRIAIEEPLEIRIRNRSICVTMRTPGHDEELAAGFLLSEGVIRRRADFLKAEPCTKPDGANILNVLLCPGVEVDWERLTRHVFGSSSCGVCGKATIRAVRQTLACTREQPRRDGGADESEQMSGPRAVVSAKSLAALPGKLRRSQAGFDETGGLHAAGLFDFDGRLIVAREDVGRHNAVDKAVGQAFLGDSPIRGRAIMVVSGRASFEIVQKGLAAGVPIIAAVGAPSSLAVELATEAGLTLAGFVRDGRMNVYCGRQRVAMEACG